MNTNKLYSPEVRERAVRLVFDSQKDDQSQWAAIQSIADKIGCTHETLRRWVRQQERDEGVREYTDRVHAGKLSPELLFPNDDELGGRLKEHPALLWKIENVKRHLSK